MSPLDPVRLAFGTLTALPVRPPARVDRPVAGWAMALAPLVGALLGVVAVVVAVLLALVLDPWLVAVLVVGLLGLCTRLIHWDGLADTADGLGSGRPAGEALEVMRRSDIGPFGVFTVVVVFAVQVAAVASLLGSAGSSFVLAGEVAVLGRVDAVEVVSRSGVAGAAGALVAALVLGRCALLVACRTGVPGARSEGLGAGVAGSVGAGQAVAGVLLATALLATALALDVRTGWVPLLVAVAAVAAWALSATAYLRRRLGGMTGDTLGALVETSTAVALVVLAAG